MGQRVQKTVNGITTTYLRDASGNVMATYSGSSVEHTIYGSSRLGIYKGGRETGQRKTGLKNYELSNHLGNVLAVISDKKVLVSDYFIADVVSATDYYPFGYAMPKREYQSSGYRYGFNGKEKNADIAAGNTDFGARNSDSKTGRWLSMDQAFFMYPYISPYSLMANSPLKVVDPTGSIIQIDKSIAVGSKEYIKIQNALLVLQNIDPDKYDKLDKSTIVFNIEFNVLNAYSYEDAVNNNLSYTWGQTYGPLYPENGLDVVNVTTDAKGDPLNGQLVRHPTQQEILKDSKLNINSLVPATEKEADDRIELPKPGEIVNIYLDTRILDNSLMGHKDLTKVLSHELFGHAFFKYIKNKFMSWKFGIMEKKIFPNTPNKYGHTKHNPDNKETEDAEKAVESGYGKAKKQLKQSNKWVEK